MLYKLFNREGELFAAIETMMHINFVCAKSMKSNIMCIASTLSLCLYFLVIKKLSLVAAAVLSRFLFLLRQNICMRAGGRGKKFSSTREL